MRGGGGGREGGGCLQSSLSPFTTWHAVRAQSKGYSEFSVQEEIIKTFGEKKILAWYVYVGGSLGSVDNSYAYLTLSYSSEGSPALAVFRHH